MERWEILLIWLFGVQIKLKVLLPISDILSASIFQVSFCTSICRSSASLHLFTCFCPVGSMYLTSGPAMLLVESCPLIKRRSSQNAVYLLV